MKEIEATRGEMASMRSENAMLRSTAEELTSASATQRIRSSTVTPMNMFISNVSFADVEPSSRRAGKQPMELPIKGTLNPSEAPHGFEIRHEQRRVAP